MTENQDIDFKGAPTPCHEWFMTANASQNREFCKIMGIDKAITDH